MGQCPTWWPPCWILVAQTRIKSSVIPFLVLRRKVWLTPTARVPCSNAANIEGKTWTQGTWQSVRGQKPPTMYISCTSPEDCQTSCKVWLTSVERRRCSNEDRARNRLKFSAMLWKRKKLPRKRKCIFNKSANVKSIKAQHRQCQSYTEYKHVANNFSVRPTLQPDRSLYRGTWPDSQLM